MSKILKLGIFALVATGIVAAAQPDQARPGRSLQAKLEAMSFYGAGEAMNLRFNLTNPSYESVWVLRWQLPSEDMDAKLFEVSRDGQAVNYTGRMVKRARPEAEDYVEIPAGETFSVIFDPSSSYEMSDQGSYTLRFRFQDLSIRRTAPEASGKDLSRYAYADPDSRRRDTLPQGKVAVAETPAVTFTFEGLPQEFKAQDPIQNVIGGYSKCTTSQQNTMKTAHNNAISIVTKAQNHIAANPNGSTLHTYWFGTYSSSRFNIVKSHYASLKDAFSNKSVVYDCGCKQNYYAYVYPTQPYKIYVCKAFWSAPALGRDSKAGTLVHEMTHFNVVAGTDDYVYGASGAHNLALTNPTQAIDNADNHEYFAEDQ